MGLLQVLLRADDVLDLFLDRHPEVLQGDGEGKLYV